MMSGSASNERSLMDSEAPISTPRQSYKEDLHQESAKTPGKENLERPGNFMVRAVSFNFDDTLRFLTWLRSVFQGKGRVFEGRSRASSHSFLITCDHTILAFEHDYARLKNREA
jgi:hypothetical protein